MEKLNQFETMSLLELRSNSHTYYFDRNCFYEETFRWDDIKNIIEEDRKCTKEIFSGNFKKGAEN